MKKRFFALCLLVLIGISIPHTCAADSKATQRLNEQYKLHCQQPSDIHQHVPILRQLSRECSSVIEIGVRSMVSSWGILKGLSENPDTHRSYLGIDLFYPPMKTLGLAKTLAEAHGISFQFWQANDMAIEIEPADMLFIDSLHTYCHLTYELEKFSPKIRKYIAMHDTSAPWGSIDDSSYQGDYSEYPLTIDRSKRGLWPAVVDFLERHPEWILHARYENNHGLTILKRK